MKDVSPQYRDRCQQQVFEMVPTQNPVLSKLKERYIEQQFANNKNKIRKYGSELKFKEELEYQAFYKMVCKLEIVLSMPEQLLIR